MGREWDCLTPTLSSPGASGCPPALWFSLPQKHPEPFFALAKELYPGQFKVSFLAGHSGKLGGAAGIGKASSGALQTNVP